MNRPEATDLGRALRSLGEHGDRLELFAATREQLDEILRDMDAVRRMLLAVRAHLGPSGCRQHPQMPVDPTTDGECLLCVQNRRRGQGVPLQAVVEEAPTSVICQTVIREGHEVAVARFGPRAVTRAILTCRNDPDFLEESA